MAERVVKSSLYLYIQSIVFALGGGAYWLIFAAILGPQEMGKAALIITTASLVSTASRLGLDYAVLKTPNSAKAATRAALKLYYATATLPTIAASLFIYTQLGPIGAAATAAYIAANAGPITAATHIATHNTQRLPIYAATSLAIRFTATLATLEHKWAAIAAGYILGTATYTLATAIPTMRNGNADKIPPLELAKSGLAAWPSQLYDMLIATAGTTTTYIKAGETQAGVFYLAYTAATVAMGLPPAIATAAIPHFASAGDTPQKMARIIAILGAPFLASVLSAPSQILTLIGEEYAQGGIDFAVLSLAMYMRSIANAYINWTYAHGNLRHYAITYTVAITIFALTSTATAPSIAAAISASSLLAPWKPRRELAHAATAAIGIITPQLLTPWLLATTTAFLATTILNASIAKKEDMKSILAAASAIVKS